MEIDAIYYDGKTARDHHVKLRIAGDSLAFFGHETPETVWSITGLHSIDPPTTGKPFRLTHQQQPGARLVIQDEVFVNQLLQKSPHLRGGYSWRDIRQVLGWSAGGIAAAVGLSFLALSFLPDRVAQILPDSWRNRVGKQMLQELVSAAKVCSSQGGDAAIGAIVARLAEGTPDFPSISVHVYDMPIMNAFAVSGGSIVLTRELINAASTPDEVAGVLAHEIGHVYHLHPEAQMVRIEGIQLLSSVFTGKTSGGTMSNIAGIATLLSYSRAAERQSDSYADMALINAKIDPAGLRRFFEKVVKLEADLKTKSVALNALGNLFATHPGTEERIHDLKMLPNGVSATPSLTEQEWQSLRKICE